MGIRLTQLSTVLKVEAELGKKLLNCLGHVRHLHIGGRVGQKTEGGRERVPVN